MTTSAYIHIPFCKSKCNYCSFISFTEQDKKLGYVYSLLKEIDTYYSGEELKTLYFGGGTPSLIDPGLIEKIIKKFNFSKECEITFEMNPDDASLDYLQSLFDIGINRISIGSQTGAHSQYGMIQPRRKIHEHFPRLPGTHHYLCHQYTYPAKHAERVDF